jgi:DNA-binding transcriptional regulator LsrR (DeoR family)
MTRGTDSAAAVKAYIARLVFEDGVPKSEIATRLGMSRFKVARLLEQARHEGIVTVEIRDPVPTNGELAARLQERYGLRLALVARSLEAGATGAIARLAAAWLPELVTTDDVLGVAWGSTLEQVVHNLPAGALPPIPVVQICGAPAGVHPGQGPVELAWQLSERVGGAFFPLPAPGLVDAPEAILQNEAIAPTVSMFERVSIAMLGIGSLIGGRSALLSSGVLAADQLPADAVGDLMFHVFAGDGSIVESRVESRAIQLGLAQLEKARVLAIAGGSGKATAIRGALRTGLVDILVTDEASARDVLE